MIFFLPLALDVAMEEELGSYLMVASLPLIFLCVESNPGFPILEALSLYMHHSSMFPYNHDALHPITFDLSLISVFFTTNSLIYELLVSHSNGSTCLLQGVGAPR